MRPSLGIALLLSVAVTGSNLIADDYVGFVNQDVLQIRDGAESLLTFKPLYWGPGWKWTGFKTTNASDGKTAVAESVSGKDDSQIKFDLRVEPRTARSFEYTAAYSANSDTESTIGVISFDPGSAIKKTVVEMADGTSRTIEGKYARAGLGDAVKAVALISDSGEAVRMAFDKPTKIVSDGAARIVLVSGKYPANEPQATKFTVTLDRNMTFYPSPDDIPFEEGFEDWYVWKPAGDYGDNNPLSMKDWIARPAGKLGRVHREGEKLMVGNQPIKLWGLNLCYANGCAPENEIADKRAELYAHHGVNAVRFHKYADGPTWDGIQSKDSFVQFNPEKLDKMDYQIAKFREYGIYSKFSAHFGTPNLGRGDLAAIPYLEEFAKFDKSERVRVPASGTYFSREAQDIQIAHYVNLLNHRNPYTGLTYAEDPAIAFVEILNEQSVLFYTMMATLKRSPTITKRASEGFCAWLRDKYGSHEGLVEAWGAKALNSFGGEGFARSGEHLDANNILPIGNPWFWDPVNLHGSQSFRRQRLLDSMTYVTTLQDDFYARFVKEIRAAGYKGEIISSNWQAGTSYSHFMNLHSDYLVGAIDRHNYFGGLGKSMLVQPGTGLLGSGMQQVADRPFMLSEWVHTRPNEFGLEGPAILGAYGMGLQGWDVSYVFQNADPAGYLTRLWAGVWEVTTPQIFGIFPAVARHVMRGDIRESELQMVRKVHVPSLPEGKLGFEDSITQKGDVKEFGGRQLPSTALAVARCPIVFSDKYEETPEYDLTPYMDGSTYVASTGQLRWTPAEGGAAAGGFFTIDTPATQAIVGFAQGETAKLSQATIALDSKFAAVYVTAARPGQSLAKSNSMVIVALARARNSGGKNIGETVVESGKAPILIEPVKATIHLNRPGVPTVRLLDHDGNRTDKTVPVNNGTFTIDGVRDQTPYYEISYGN